MADTFEITTLFLDIGGVILTNGWDKVARKRTAEAFSLDIEELNERHHLTFDTYEAGKIDIDRYLDRVVFYTKRSFTRSEFKDFMFQQSQPFPEMIALFRKLKEQYKLRIVTVSNEPRELNDYRIQTFDLRSLIDVFVTSCFVHLRKPDADIYRVAIDISQVRPDKTLYIDDRAMFVDEAKNLGLHGLQHVDYQSTIEGLKQYGLTLRQDKTK
jgi:putative hydrolase of the HAD superfamily